VERGVKEKRYARRESGADSNKKGQKERGENEQTLEKVLAQRKTEKEIETLKLGVQKKKTPPGQRSLGGNRDT